MAGDREGDPRAVLAKRPKPKDEADAGLVFVTKYGGTWTKQDRDNPMSKETAKLLKALGLHRPGVNFYALRHVFRTVADAARDPVAIDLIMGHTDPSMGGHYRERIEDGRLRAVAEHVRHWLFGEPDGGTEGRPEAAAPEGDGRADAGGAPGPDAGNVPPMLRLFAG